MSENETTPSPEPRKPRLLSAVTLRLPTRQTSEGLSPGLAIRPGHEIPTEGISEERIESWLREGIAYFEDRPMRLRDVKPARREQDLNISSVKKGEVEDNPLDQGCSLKSGEGDPALAAKIAAMASAQAAKAEADGEDLLDQPDAEPKHVFINAETGEERVEGGEEFFEDDGPEDDSQVTD